MEKRELKRLLKQAIVEEMAVHVHFEREKGQGEETGGDLFVWNKEIKILSDCVVIREKIEGEGPTKVLIAFEDVTSFELCDKEDY